MVHNKGVFKPMFKPICSGLVRGEEGGGQIKVTEKLTAHAMNYGCADTMPSNLVDKSTYFAGNFDQFMTKRLEKNSAFSM